jgi:hypothetical protein
MKRQMIRGLMALVLVLSIATIASADTVVFNGAAFGSFFNADAKVTGGNPSPLIRTNQPAGEFSITWNGNNTWAFCVDFFNSIDSSQSATPTPVNIKGSEYVLAAYLLDKYRIAADTPKESAALQAAVWRAIYGTNFTLLSSTNDDVEAYYAIYTSDLTVPGDFTGANYTFLDLYKIADDNKVVRQGLITGVPEPMTMILFGLGLIGLAGLRRKK